MHFRIGLLGLGVLALAAAGCHLATDPAPPAVSAGTHGISRSTPTPAPVQVFFEGDVRGPAAGVLANNAASVLSDAGSGLISNGGAGLISLAKFRALALSTEAVAGADVRVEDLHGRVLSPSVSTDDNGHFRVGGSFGAGTVLAIRASYRRANVPISLLAAVAAPKEGATATAPVDTASTLVAKKLAAMVRLGAVDEGALAPAAIAQVSQQIAPDLTDAAAVGAAILPEDRTAHLFDAVVVQLGKVDATRRQAIDATGATALLAATPEGTLPSPSPTTAPSPPPASVAPSASPSASPSRTPTPSVAPPTPTPSPTANVLLGAFTASAPAGPTTELDKFATWLGKPVLLGQDHAAGDTWDNLEGPNWQLPSWGQWKAAGTGRRLLYELPMFPGPGDGSGPTSGKNVGPVSLAAGATGAYDAHWTQLAQNLVAAGLADTIVDPGYQCNLDYLAWNGRNNRTGYAQYYQHIVNAMRAVPGAHFQFAWGLTPGGGWNTEEAYPGDAYVDYIALDFGDTDYDRYGTTGTVTSAQQDAVWQNLLTEYRGLNFWTDFSHQHGNKALGVTSWSLDLATNNSGGDDPAFVQHMADWLGTPADGVAFHIYFNEADGPHDHVLSTAGTAFPNAAAKFKQLFGH